jgi:Polyketide cyclase / dehydrase and lipid transport
MPKGFASSVIDAPVDEVWTRIRDFNALPVWHPAIDRSEIEGGRPSEAVGCVRSFYLADGGHIRETLLELSDARRSVTYDMQEGPMAWSNYVATLRLLPISDGNRTYIEWSAEFDAEPEDAPGLIDLVEKGVFQGGFDALKEHFAGR